ncbi:MAG: hypothetical protein EDX89_22640 [Acidobacteria bacterium]|nr:MAG: hypothetical protein EDX89_22640 [Acidobacteriota bacterium]
MCLQPSAIRPWQKWHWAGDQIFRDTVVPAHRLVPRTRITGYDIDIREYVAFAGNAVVRHLLDELLERLPAADQARFVRHRIGDFDFRVETVCELFSAFRHEPDPRGYDTWYFPEETIVRGGGDCEDLAFLLAALLEAAGISRGCLRVALGNIVDHANDGEPRGHAWVVYQDEPGAWRLLEPMTLVKNTPREPKGSRGSGRGVRRFADVEYVPLFVFNGDHLWTVRSQHNPAPSSFADWVEARKDLARQRPAFAASEHAHIFDDALKGMAAGDLRRVKAVSLWQDVDTLVYDPRDHFDFAYVQEGWLRILDRLLTKDLSDFAKALHAVGDFYAHTYWGYFTAKPGGGALPLWTPAAPPNTSGFAYDFSGFEEIPGCALGAVKEHPDPVAAAAKWKGRLISGQWWRWYSTYPDDLEADLPERRCLPDHDDVAVDKPAGRNALSDERGYSRQFALRKEAATRHIKQIYAAW